MRVCVWGGELVMCGCVYFGFCNVRVCVRVCVGFVMHVYVGGKVCNVWVCVCVGFVIYGCSEKCVGVLTIVWVFW